MMPMTNKTADPSDVADGADDGAGHAGVVRGREVCTEEVRWIFPRIFSFHQLRHSHPIGEQIVGPEYVFILIAEP